MLALANLPSRPRSSCQEQQRRHQEKILADDEPEPNQFVQPRQITKKLDRLGAERFAQAADMDVDGTLLDIYIPAPSHIKQLPTREHTAASFH